MARTLSTMLDLGTSAPHFSLPDTNGKLCSFGDYPSAKAYLVMFICNHCPYVVHVRKGIVELAKDFQKQGIAVFAINSNDVESFPEDSPEKMKEYVEKYHYTFPYLFDSTQDVAKAFKAACTPDFFLFDNKKKLIYRGQMDGSRPSNSIPNDGIDLRNAIKNLFANHAISSDQKPSLGCNIKWKT